MINVAYGLTALSLEAALNPVLIYECVTTFTFFYNLMFATRRKLLSVKMCLPDNRRLLRTWHSNPVFARLQRSEAAQSLSFHVWIRRRKMSFWKVVESLRLVGLHVFMLVVVPLLVKSSNVQCTVVWLLHCLLVFYIFLLLLWVISPTPDLPVRALVVYTVAWWHRS